MNEERNGYNHDWMNNFLRALNWTQEELAGYSGIPPDAVCRFDAKKWTPKADSLCKLMDAFRKKEIMQIPLYFRRDRTVNIVLPRKRMRGTPAFNPAWTEYVREILGIDQSHLSLAAGIAHASVYKYETGIAVPTAQNLCGLLEAARSEGVTPVPLYKVGKIEVWCRIKTDAM